MEMEGYQKIKTVGKGSFGTAFLYRKIVDNELVVMKDVYLCDMTPVERNLALNEVQVLSSLHHENIIRYLGNFQRDGSLIIIMEYANGGNLIQLINIKRDRKETFSEAVILDIFSQICAGISYMHGNKILHRDLKSANIFLNKNGTVKIGDFGISKVMDTRSQAQTVVGTPYYLSPEMCEGKEYNEKSDIWAMGCILYELACLRKPFEAPSLPILVQKITRCDFPSIPETYSDGLFHLIEMILQRDYDKRPTAQYIKNTIIPTIFQSHDYPRRLSLTSMFNNSITKERSILYQLTGFTSEPNLFPTDLPHKKILSFSISSTHCIAVTSDRRVYTWGEDNYGQLSYGHQGIYKKNPICVDYLREKNIIKCFAGDGFSLFINEIGWVYSCGDGKFGCLGHGDWKTVLQPKIIDSIVNAKISFISCGTKHVLALGENGTLYSWGSSDQGQLGLGHSQQCCKPMVIKVSNEYNIQKIYAGPNSSALLTTSGKVLISGYNSYNKLGFNDVSNIKTFIFLHGINAKIKEISMSASHTVLLTESGNVLCMGNNNEGQLGNGDNIKGTVFKLINGLSKVEMISAGQSYTIAATNDNVLYFWGTYFKQPNRSNSSNNSRNSMMPLLHNSPMQEIESRFYKLKYSETQTPEQNIPIIESIPTSLIALYASSENVKNGNILWLSEIKANLNCITILVHTTVPPPAEIKNNEEPDDHSQVMEEKWFGSDYMNKIDVDIPNTTNYFG